MAEKKSPKKTFNPLLNASVTGATLEEFTQNAILCPAAEPVSAPILQTVPLNNQPEPEQSTNSFTSINQQVTNNFTNQQQEPPHSISYNYNPQPASNSSVFTPFQKSSTAPNPRVDPNSSTLSSSVLSSFSNILNFGNQIKKEEFLDPVVPNLNSVEHLLNSNEGQSNANFVPLYSSNTYGDSYTLSGPSLSGPPLTGPALSGSSRTSSRFRAKTPSGTSTPLTEPPLLSEYSGTSPSAPPIGLSRPSSSRSSPGLYAPKTHSPGLTSSGLSGPISGKSTPDLSISGRPPLGSSSDVPTFPLTPRAISPSLSRSRSRTSSPGSGIQPSLSVFQPTQIFRPSFSSADFADPPSVLTDSTTSSSGFGGYTIPPYGLNSSTVSSSEPNSSKVPPSGSTSVDSSFGSSNSTLPSTGLPGSTAPPSGLTDSTVPPYGLTSSAIHSSVFPSSTVPPPQLPVSVPISESSSCAVPQSGFTGSTVPASTFTGPVLPSSVTNFTTPSGFTGSAVPPPGLGNSTVSPLELRNSTVPPSGLPDSTVLPSGLPGFTGPQFRFKSSGFPVSSSGFNTENSSELTGSKTGTKSTEFPTTSSASRAPPSVPFESTSSTSEIFIPGFNSPRLPSPSSGANSGISSTGLFGPEIPSTGISGSFAPSARLTKTGISGPPLAQSAPTLPPTFSKGSNTYRKQGQKRIAYAPIPGFFSTPLQSVPQPQIEPNPYFPTSTYDPLNTANSAQIQSHSQPSIFAPPPVVEAKPSNLLVPSNDFNEVQSLDGTPAFYSSVLSDAKTPSNITPATLHSSATLFTTPMTATESGQVKPATTMNSAPYRPVYHHWFYRKKVEGRVIWQPFSMLDSLALEAAFVSTDLSPENMVATDGGRYDVNILRRQKTAVYWESAPTDVRRCSWFYKTVADGKFVPYKENIATKLEEEYKAAYELNQWHRRVELPKGETVVFHSPDVLVLFPQSATPDIANQPPNQTKPQAVKRGMDEFDIDEGEPSKIDHLLFLVHGIGSVCDLKFRSVEEVVDDFRNISLQLVQSHYKSSCDRGIANRIEVLPVSWHNQLHSDETGIDQKLKSITLDSIPRLRGFTNDTLLDILFYTSPIYCQTIISTVGNEINRIYALFKKRNPGFQGAVSLGGHSLGSLILFDILCHQHPEDTTPTEEDDVVGLISKVQKPSPSNRRLSRRISYMMGAVGTGQPQLIYPHLDFSPVAFFALGSPIGMFVAVRGLDSLGEQFALPTCQGFFNIFHPYDPVAYRIESLINPELANVRPVLIPHHKGRKRMHLELKETMARVGADLKQRVVESMKSTWNSVYQLAMFHRSDNRSLEAEVDKVLKEQIASEESARLRANSIGEEESQSDVSAGILNNGRRIDYVLQEAPFEIFNEYIFALTSHVCYWESEDTMLLILKEIYNSMGISTDSKIPQQTMTIQRSSPSIDSDGGRHSIQMPNSSRPTIFSQNQGVPPTTGFIRKT